MPNRQENHLRNMARIRLFPAHCSLYRDLHTFSYVGVNGYIYLFSPKVGLVFFLSRNTREKFPFLNVIFKMVIFNFLVVLISLFITYHHHFSSGLNYSRNQYQPDSAQIRQAAISTSSAESTTSTATKTSHLLIPCQHWQSQ